MPDKTLLLTGFQPFAEFAANPSEAVVRKLDGEVIGGYQVKGLVLPVVFGESGDLLVKAVEELQPDAVICLGLAADRQGISIERLAANLDDTIQPDNAGNRPVECAINGDGPPAYWSTLPVKAMVNALQDAGAPASLSMSAGTFVCNHVFYRLLDALQHSPDTRGGFVHLPQVADEAALDKLVDNIRIMIAAL